MARRSVLPLVMTLLVVVAAGCAVTADGQGHRNCPSSSIRVPACGVIWGAATDPSTRTYLESVEARLGRPFDMVYRFHDLDDQIPTSDERAIVADGRTLHVSIDARIYGPPNHTVLWTDIARGQYDAGLVAQARGIASLGVPVFVTFDHEPDRPDQALSGTSADFVAAWRHVHDLFERAGATKAIWVWVVTGYPATFQTAGRMWPGNAYVDWTSWEAYNASGCRAGKVDPAAFQGFAASVLPFEHWLKQHGPQLDIDTTKPIMISEAGSVLYEGDPGLTAKWYDQIPTVLREHPEIKAISLWDRPGVAVCEYKFDQVPAVSAVVSRVGLQPPIRGN